MTDSGTDLNIGGLSLTAGNLNFTLTQDTGNLTTSGAIDINSGNLSVVTTDGSQTYSNTIDANDVTLDANGQNSDLTFNAAITTVSGGTVTLTADDSILFTTASSDITSLGAGNLSITANTATTNGDSGDLITMVNGVEISSGSGTLTLTSTGANSGDITIGRLLSSNAASSAITVTAGLGAVLDGNTTAQNFVITGSGGVVIDAATGVGTSGDSLELTAGSVDVDNTTSGGIFLTEVDNINIVKLNSSSANGDITVSAAGTINITVDGAIAAGSGNVALTASAGSIEDTAGTGNAKITTTGTISLTASAGVGQSAVLEIASSSNLTVDSNQSIQISSSTALTDLTLTVNPSVLTDATYSIAATNFSTFTLTDNGANVELGQVALSSGSLNLSLTTDSGNLDIGTAGTVNTGTSGNLTIVSAGNISDTNALTVTGTSSFTVTGTNTITLDNTSNAFSGAITLASGTGAVQLIDSTATSLAASTLGGALTITSSGTITQTGILNVTGNSSFTTNVNNQAITLSNPGNNFGGTVAFTTQGTTGNVTIDNGSTNLQLAASTIQGTFSARSGGTITQTVALIIDSTASFQTDVDDRAITLSDTGNAIAGAVTFTTQTTASHLGNVTIDNGTTALAIQGNIAGNLVVTAGAAITDSGALTVSATSSFTIDAGSNNITLGTANLADTITVSTTGTSDFTLDNTTTNVDLGTLGVTGNLSVTTGGTIIDSGVLTVTGTSAFTTDVNNQTITLNSATNQFGGAVTLTTQGSTANVIIDGGTTALAIQGNVAGNLAVTAGATITDSAALTVSGTSSFTTDVNDQSITLNNANALT